MSARSKVIAAIRSVSEEQNWKLAPLSDDLPLMDTGLDSLGLATLIARLEDEFGIDPFANWDDSEFPVTVGDLVRIYERLTKEATAEPGPAGSPETGSLAQNLGRLAEESANVLAAGFRPREEGGGMDTLAHEFVEAARTAGKVAEFWFSDPRRTFEMQTRLGRAYLDLWTSTAHRVPGEPAMQVVMPEVDDNRFADEEWSVNPFFDFVKQAYLVNVQWIDSLVKDASDLDERTRRKADFYAKQISAALAPSNFLFTNPELLRETRSSQGENLVRGMQMFAEDLEAGQGRLKIRHTEPSTFELGRNLAVTPGKVIFQNELMQLIQYQATGPEVLKVPLLVVPPWINKYYILDLSPDKSFIRWCVERGLTVFAISWVNPDARLAHKSFEQYMHEGVIAALNVIESVTGERKVNAVGYCVGGTLLAMTLAYLAARKEDRAVSATLLAAQVDFTYAGDLALFVDEERISQLEAHMKARGYLEASYMAYAFGMLHAEDMIWPYMVNNYLRGKRPFSFDVLYWNSDATRIAAANQSFHLRNLYLDNGLAGGKLQVDGMTLSLRNVTVPVYNVGGREDRISPARSVLHGARSFGGPVRNVLVDSGHVAGLVVPPGRPDLPYWTDGQLGGADLDAWISTATRHAGSFWNDWFEWLSNQGSELVPRREIGAGGLAPIEDAPGSYVKLRSWG
jgi:polyhydroxyalkanoate synthase